MALNYEEAIAELRAEESRLQDELKQVQAAIPAMIILRNRARMEREIAKAPQLSIVGMGKFAGMGATKAIPEFLESAERALTSREIFDGLSAQGWTTDAQKPIGVISATLIALEDKGIVTRVGEAWKLKGPQLPIRSTEGDSINAQLRRLAGIQVT